MAKKIPTDPSLGCMNPGTVVHSDPLRLLFLDQSGQLSLMPPLTRIPWWERAIEWLKRMGGV